ncbi:MAG: alkaline phytoceramidase [bacterium]|nr:alkaline phytoceramidase [bacterium]
MTSSPKTRKSRILLLFAVALVAIAGAFSIAPIPQDLAYHDFADKRAFGGIANFGDVMSNLAFAVVAIFGIIAARKRRPVQRRGEFQLWAVFFAGVFMVAFGSGYYHLEPNNKTLVWDRLPMTIAFMALFSIVVMERVDERWGIRLFPVFLICGIASVWYWDYTEGLGRGDLRPYALVQFLPMLAILTMIPLFPPKYRGSTRYLLSMLGCYAVAKLLELFDMEIFSLAGCIVSGHTLKHLAAAAGVAFMVAYVKAGKQ